MRLLRCLGLLAVTLALLAAMKPQAATAASKQPCNIPSPTGTRTVPLFDQGQDRPFLLHVPQGYDGHHRLPLVLNLHISAFDAQTQMTISQMGEAADRRGLAVAAPNGAVPTGPSRYEWNDPGAPPFPPGTPDDEQYLLRVIEAVEDTLCIDAKRVYIAGYSSGGRMASQMACDHPQEIAAIAPVAGLRAGLAEPTSSGGFQPDPKTCRPGDVVPVLAFHGTADPVIPYFGNDDPVFGYAIETALARWAKINRCQRGPRTKSISVSVEKISYRDCRAHGKVALYRANGAGHTWPGSTFPAIGPIDQTIDATELILDFFAKHPQQK